jgi:hypothetical protein
MLIEYSTLATTWFSFFLMIRFEKPMDSFIRVFLTMMFFVFHFLGIASLDSFPFPRRSSPVRLQKAPLGQKRMNPSKRITGTIHFARP